MRPLPSRTRAGRQRSTRALRGAHHLGIAYAAAAARRCALGVRACRRASTATTAPRPRICAPRSRRPRPLIPPTPSLTVTACRTPRAQSARRLSRGSQPQAHQAARGDPRVFLGVRGHITSEELHQRVREKHPQIGYTTVYPHQEAALRGRARERAPLRRGRDALRDRARAPRPSCVHALREDRRVRVRHVEQAQQTS